MTVQTTDYLKSRFQDGDIPSGQDFADLIDSIFRPVTIAADHVTYGNDGYPAIANVQQALDTLLYVAPQASITNSVGTVEIGSTVAAVTLDWTVNKAIIGQSIAAPGPGTIDPALRTLALSGLHLTADTTFTLAVDDGTHTASAATPVLFRHRRRWGVSAQAVPDAALIDALAGAEFAAGRTQSRSFSPSGQYLYFAWPSSFGTPVFLVNGLLNTAWVKTTVGYTNPSGYTANFDVYRSQFLQSGGQQVVVQ
ncbi:hypothetical protein SAMN02949497_3404 [Methylomagnum ishizawai]|uniref:Uncharacterized protein n=1 Tax=Methylomagnum ishizawai TaxID=1760988 RepID=A0A1Y6D6P0_9GAMM|nr:hypothetical protein [Methylomagnum ishizawai]SMF96024.1 hypothetical protein SAMN02949497_3404 [Methylomagnum ishizawai]